VIGRILTTITLILIGILQIRFYKLISKEITGIDIKSGMCDLEKYDMQLRTDNIVMIVFGVGLIAAGIAIFCAVFYRI